MIKEVVKNVSGKVSGLSGKNVAEASIGTGIGILAVCTCYVVCSSISDFRKRKKRIRETEENVNKNKDEMLNNLTKASEIYGEYMDVSLGILENVTINLDNLTERVSELEDNIFDGDYLSDKDDFSYEDSLSEEDDLSDDDYENDKNNSKEDKE